MGVETISAAVSEDKDTIENVYEPFLIREGLIEKTPKGRKATRLAYEHLGIPRPEIQPRTSLIRAKSRGITPQALFPL